MARPPKYSVDNAIWTDSFDGASVNPAYITSNSVGTVVDTNSGAGSLRIKTTGTAIKGYLDWGRAAIYLPGLLNFDLTCDVVLNGSVEQYPDISFRCDTSSATGAPDVTGNGYDLEFGGVNTGSWLNQADAGTLTSNVVTETTSPQPGNGTLTKVHIVAYDDQIRAKKWTSGTAGEPDDWLINYTNRVHNLAVGRSYFILGIIGGSNNGCDGTYDNLRISRLYLGRLWSDRRALYYSTSTPINAGNATVAFTAYDQSSGSRTQSQPTVALTAFGISSPRAITNAALTVIANNISLVRNSALGLAQVDFTANAISSPNRPLGTATLPFTAYNQTATSPVTITAQTANMSFAANDLSASRALNLATWSLTANALSSPRTQTAATLSLTAFDESVSTTKALGLASLSFTSNNASLLTTYSLGLATLGFTANNLSALRNQSAATLSFTANPVSSPRQSNVASFSLTAYNQSRTLIQALQNATLSFTAFNESLTQISNLPLGSASFALAALDLTPFILRSAGLAAFGLTAAPSTALRPSQETTGGVATAAFPVSLGSGRNADSGLLDFSAYGVSLLTNSQVNTGVLTFGAFNVHIVPQVNTRVKYTIRGVVVNETTIEGFIANTSIDGNVTNKTIGGNVGV